MKYQVSLLYGEDLNGNKVNIYHLDSDFANYANLLYKSFDGVMLGWFTREQFKAYFDDCNKNVHGVKHLQSLTLEKWQSGEDVSGVLVTYYVAQLIDAIEAENLPLVHLSELHNYCDANALLNDVLGNPYEDDGLDTSLYWGDLVSESYNRTLQG